MVALMPLRWGQGTSPLLLDGLPPMTTLPSKCWASPKGTSIKPAPKYIATAAFSLGFFNVEFMSYVILCNSECETEHYLIQRISMAVQRRNAASILSSTPTNEGLEEIFFSVNAYFIFIYYLYWFYIMSLKTKD